MAEPERTAQALTRAAIQKHEQGDSEYAPAWLWLGAVVTEPAQRRFCLQPASAIAPDVNTSKALRRLRSHFPVPPPEVVHLADPPAPPMFTAQPKISRLTSFLFPGHLGGYLWAKRAGVELAQRIHLALRRSVELDGGNGLYRHEYRNLCHA